MIRWLCAWLSSTNGLHPMAASALFGAFGATYFFFPKMFGRMMSEKLGKLHFWLSAIFINVTFFPQHFAGLAGMQRRVPDYAVQFVDFNVWSTVGAFVFFFAQFIFVYNMLASCYGWGGRKRDLTDRVWDGATGLEWTVPSPAPYHTFEDQPLIGDDGEPVKGAKTAAAH